MIKTILPPLLFGVIGGLLLATLLVAVTRGDDDQPLDWPVEIRNAYETQDRPRLGELYTAALSTIEARHQSFPVTTTALARHRRHDGYYCRGIYTSQYHFGHIHRATAQAECLVDATAHAGQMTATAVSTPTYTPEPVDTPTSTPTQVPVVHTVIVEREVVVTATPTPCVEPTIDPERIDEHHTCPAPNPDESTE